MEPGSYTAGSDASQDDTPDPRPFLLKLLICFLLADGAERAVELVLWFLDRLDAHELSPSPYAPDAPQIVAIVIWIFADLFLALLLILRTAFGRIWTQLIFLIHIAYVVQFIALRHPEVWVYLDDVGRLRLVLTVLVDLCAVLYLFSGSSRASLAR